MVIVMQDHECEYTSVCCGVGEVEGTDFDSSDDGIIIGFCGSCNDATGFECVECEEAIDSGRYV